MSPNDMAANQQKSTAEKPSPEPPAMNRNSSADDARQKEPGHFNRWWREYQQKMKASLAGVNLKLQVEASR